VKNNIAPQLHISVGRYSYFWLLASSGATKSVSLQLEKNLNILEFQKLSFLVQTVLHFLIFQSLSISILSFFHSQT
jgi:hypothetical protein